MAAQEYSYADFISKDYRWSPDGKILVTAFSQIFPLGNAEQRHYWKFMEENDYGNVDVDFMTIKRLFDKVELAKPVEVIYKTAVSFDDYKNYLEEVDKGKDIYDCFFFIFLTYSTPEYGNSYDEEKLHFYEKSLEKGLRPQADVIKEVMKMKSAVGKPKIFLIQADDIGLLGAKEYLKGPTVVPDFVNMKLPQDADRLIIKSKIPQHIANYENGKYFPKMKRPSMLIEAFVEVIFENANREQTEKKDFYSLTTSINRRIAHRIKKQDHPRQEDMYAPLVTSTLSKFLNL